MSVHCIHCGEEIDIGSVGPDEPDGNLHITFNVRRGFRESSAGVRLHAGCFEEVFNRDMPVPGWAAED